MKKFYCSLLVLVILVPLSLTACSGGGLSGTYSGEAKYGEISINFKSSGECTWHEGGSVFNGTYEETSDGYYLLIKGSGFITDQEFNAVKDGEDLIITVYKEEVKFTLS